VIHTKAFAAKPGVLEPPPQAEIVKAVELCVRIARSEKRSLRAGDRRLLQVLVSVLAIRDSAILG
jgi:hypothetical protein